jgi:uncharacterized protein with PIN domain
VKFIADGMLGKLVRWLRVLGQNVQYSNILNDTELILRAKKEKRILLTRDLELYQRAVARGIDAFYMKNLKEAEKLAELANKFDVSLEIDLERTRCPKCNTRIRPTQKEKLKDRIEKKTYIHYDEFWKCPNCNQIYWQGSHWDRISATLEEAERIRNSYLHS